MKVGHEAVDHRWVTRGIQKERRPAVIGGKTTGLSGGGFQGAYDRGAHSNDTATACVTSGDRVDCFAWTRTMFGVNAKIFDAISVDGFKRPWPNSEFDVRALDPHGGELVQ